MALMRERGLNFVRRLEALAGRQIDYLVKSEEDTNPEYGFIPEERPIDMHLKYGLIVVDKPPGPTSHEVVAWIKSMLNVSKAGHGGTLEPRPSAA